MAIIRTRYNSNCLGGFVSFNAVLPFEDFGKDFLNPNPHPYRLKQPLRTLYLLHGVTGDESDWLYGTRIERYAIENNIAVIMPDGNNNFYVNNALMERWGDFIGMELIEVTRSLFPLSDRREDTYIGGLSMGGYGALRNGLYYEDVFSKILALSSALITYDVPSYTEEDPMPWRRKSEAERLFGPIEKVLGSDKDPEFLFMKREKSVQIFMACGTEDFLLQHNRRFVAFLEEQKADLTYIEEAGAHEWEFWDRNIKRGLEWINQK